MFEKRSLPQWLTRERFQPLLITGLTLFFVSYAFDLILTWRGIPAAATMLNNIAIGLLGALLLAFFLYSVALEQNFRHGKERVTLVADLNHRIRTALVTIESSSRLDDKEERSRRVGEAVESIDRILMDLFPTTAVGSRR